MNLRSRNRLGRLVVGLVLLMLGISCCALSIQLAVVELDLPGAIAIRTLPLPPGAVPRSLARDKIRFDGVFHLASREMYDVNSPVPDIRAFYKKELGKQGWALVKEVNIALNDLCLVLTQFDLFRVSIQITGYPMNSEQTSRAIVIVNTASRPVLYESCH